MVDLPGDEYDTTLPEESEERIKRAELARKEGRATIEEQSKTLTDIDEKAIQVFRIYTVLAGIIVSGISITVNSQSTTIESILNGFTKTGGVLLFFATVMAAVTYTSTSERVGVSKEDIQDRILNEEYDLDLIQEGLAEEYATWIRYNFIANVTNALLFTITLMSGVAAITYMFIGVIDIYNDSAVTWHINIAVIASFLVFGKFSGLYGQLMRWWNLTSPISRLVGWMWSQARRFQNI